MSITYELVKSWHDTEGNVNSTESILDWVNKRNNCLKVNVEKIDFSYDGFWYYENKTGFIQNKNESFFKLAGYQEIDNDQIVAEQPIIIQDEIGYLGIICKMINGTLNLLMQAKIEPGNVNVIQISPTIQATKSNFTRLHGGRTPLFLDSFIDTQKNTVIVDQLQSEQASRFYKKRNRNIILLTEDEIDVPDSHMWMTLGQIKELMKHENLVNMDTRTVLSCIPFFANELLEKEKSIVGGLFADPALYDSVFGEVDYAAIRNVFSTICDYKMFRHDSSRLLPLKSLKGWRMTDKEIICKTDYDFKLIYCRIEIEGREVKYWEQPLIEALGQAVIGTFTCVDKRTGKRKFMARVKHEMGSFDGAELGPVAQFEPSNPMNNLDDIEKSFIEHLDNQDNVVYDTVLSEEGGRFYHEQNRNCIIEIDEEEVKDLPKGVFWLDYATICHMIQFNNCVNIQLRNLMALLMI